MNTVYLILYFAYGICIGSFLNVVIYRLPLSISMARGRSFCPKCNHQLSAADLFPVLSFLFLKGKCRYCGCKISLRYPAIELFTGMLYALSFLRFGVGVYSILVCLIISVFICAAMIDYDCKIVPDRFHAILFVLAVFTYAAYPEISVLSRILGAVVIGGIMLAVSLLTGGGIGGGDIKLMGVTGLILGLWLNVFAFFAAYVLAALALVWPVLKKEAGAKTEVPMVPFFAISSCIALLYGEGIIAWYFSLF